MRPPQVCVDGTKHRRDNVRHPKVGEVDPPSQSAVGDLIKHCFRGLPLGVAENWV